MYLWQIRHIPIPRQTFLRFTASIGLILLVAGWAICLVRSANGQGADKPAAPASEATATNASNSAADPEATAFVARVHSELKKHASVKAEIEHAVSIGNQQFRATGRYLSSGPKLRVEYTVVPDEGVEGSLIEVCNGKELWSFMTLGGKRTVTHRDVQQIKEAIASSKNVTEAELVGELGLGGLTGLLASLERNMVFEQMKKEESGDSSRVVVQGKWKPSVTTKWTRKPGDPLPAYIPDAVRILVNGQTLFPERIVYLKKQAEKDKKGYRSLVSFKFQNVELGSAIDEQEFTFDPPQDVVPEDVTRIFLDRIAKSQDKGTPPSTPNPGGAKANSKL